MVRVTVDLWMWLSEELGGDFRCPSQMRSILETTLEEGTTARELFEELSERYPPIKRKVFRDHSFDQYVVVNLNDRSVSAVKLCDRVLEDGDKITVLPMYLGG
ncbi:MAG: MoaD/ThiS family protein [Chloroflexota bacterium]